jgi:retinoid hydroxylase
MINQLKPAGMMPGVTGWPILGVALDLANKQEQFYWEQHQRYGHIFQISAPIFGFKNVACLVGPEANRLVFKDAADCFSSKLGNKNLASIVSEDAVLLKDGEEHRTNRKMIMPIFHSQAIGSYFSTMKSLTEEAVANWLQQGTIDLNDELHNLTLAIVVKIFLGIENPQEIAMVSSWFTTLIENHRFPLLRWDVPFTKFGQGMAARRRIVAYVEQEIAARKQRGTIDRVDDALGLLLQATDEAGTKFTEVQVINQILGFLFAGHETSANLLTWIMFELGNNPTWRQKLRAEQQQVIGSASLSAQHLRQLPQLTNVIKEGERLYPPAFALVRGVVADVEYSGYNIPAGWYVLLFPLLTHRLPEIYANPDIFDPDRFAPPREEDKKFPFSLIGFGGGAHGCIGLEFAQMEMKIILSALLQSCDWTVTPTAESIAPVRRQFMTLKQLQATISRA